jgi:holo-[acyl-carrier protein] synthase
MIVGMGVDIAEVSRIEAAIGRHGAAFLRRVFTAAEIRYCESHRNAAERYAARFAAKEAAMKALGTGWRRGVRWVDLEVANLPGGRPTLRLHGRSKELAEEMGVRRIALSITHGAGLAFAQVIFEGD